MVQANVRGRDLAGFVADAQRRVAAEVALPRGYRLEWGGTFENLQSATKRLTIVVPLALALIFLLLYCDLRLDRAWGVLIFLSVPLAAIGGRPGALAAGAELQHLGGRRASSPCRASPCSTAWCWSPRSASSSRPAPRCAEAVHEAAMIRLRPILMTGLVASLGFVPMALSHGSGAEVQRPLATVVIGGLITSTLLKLVVLPAIYPWFDPGPPNES